MLPGVEVVDHGRFSSFFPPSPKKKKERKKEKERERKRKKEKERERKRKKEKEMKERRKRTLSLFHSVEPRKCYSPELCSCLEKSNNDSGLFETGARETVL